MVKYRQDDVFAVPVDDDSVVLGRIVRDLRGIVLIAVYADLVKPREKTDLDGLAGASPVFLAMTMDNRLRAGHWPIIGNWSPQVELDLPRYKVQVSDGTFYEQHLDGGIGRQLTLDEAEQLGNHTSYSNAVVEMAARAHLGREPWLPVFDAIRLDRSVR
jgi:hypothetical protein